MAKTPARVLVLEIAQGMWHSSQRRDARAEKSGGRWGQILPPESQSAMFSCEKEEEDDGEEGVSMFRGRLRSRAVHVWQSTIGGR
ncbi:uncharacterized protein GLRG_09827 [Colletotrichum graminicola M1.001]|uniref:Uncharacterized protein n=1 Tax=Colletotrichum graminicola (strain M1.001 / M2 / FGSC 10212) TaxID=645133 RepID=E3QUZ5_COLGM|nr:uncharacterized protein GLRG_09827 [Colletotrichum graminicola M1.001]EFQ34683.1 hypothetical protein GLRG_09827 [Colletotrichum graminicola M1.001]